MPFDPKTAKPVGFDPTTATPVVTASQMRALADARAREKKMGGGGAAQNMVQSAMLGFGDEMGAIRAKGETYIKNLVDQAQGKKPEYTPDEAANAARQVYNENLANYQKSHPTGSLLSSIAGSFLTPGLGEGAGWAGEGGSLLSKALRGAGLGALVGAVSGAGNAQDGQRLQGAATGATVGGVIGGAAPVAVEATKTVGAPVARVVNKAVNSLTGGKASILNPKAEALRSVANALKRDGATAEQAKNITNEWLKTGASSPTLMDMASKLPSGGQATIGLIRGAALPAGPARGAVVDYANNVAANLQDNAINHTMRLTPNETRPAQAVLDELKNNQALKSAAEYGAPYAQQVEASPIMPALQGQAGARGIRAAAKEADAMAMRPEIAARIPQLQQLAQGIPDDLQNVDLGTLDRIKVALNNMGDEAAANGRGGEASGFYQRAKVIDQHLADSSPVYAAARDAYAQRAQGIDSLSSGMRGYSMTPDQLSMNTPDKASAGIGYRQALTDQIGAPTEGALGSLNKIGTSTNQTQKLSDLYGPQAAEQYQGAINNERLRAMNANSINPLNGSRTAVNMADTVDANMVGHAMSAAHGNFGPLLAKFLSGPTLTDQEREQIVKLILGQAVIPEQAATSSPVLSPYVVGATQRQQNGGQ